MTFTPTEPASARLYFLDWLRILAFFLLIAYHTGMYYVSWDWHVKSAVTIDAIEPLMMLSSPWRMGLLFLIAGVAASHLLPKLGARDFVRQRSVRLLLPLLFGMLVIVPPQAWIEVIDRGGYRIGYLEFMGRYLSAYQGFCKDGDSLLLPTWNHLWFLPYLWTYSMLLAAASCLAGAWMERAAAALGSVLRGWWIVIVPALVLGSVRILLAYRFPTTHALIDDWYSHAIYGFLFLLGALLGRKRDFWPRLEPLRWPALAIFIVCWASMVVYYELPYQTRSTPDMWAIDNIMLMVGGWCCWSAIVAVCGFAYRHLNHDSTRRRYLTGAVFPIYILHQTLIVTLAFALKPVGLPPAIEAPMLMAVTLCLSFAGFAIARRSSLLRPLLGIGRDSGGVDKPATSTRSTTACPTASRTEQGAATSPN